MNLYIFPEAASFTNGYGIAVEYAYQKLNPNSDDIVVWYSDLSKDKILHYRPNDIIIPRFGHKNIKSLKNIINGRPRVELDAKDLSFLLRYSFDKIHCDDVIFYRGLRSLFPDKFLHVRFHNSFSRINCRRRLARVDVDNKFLLTLSLFDRLEQEIFNDKNCQKIFISDEDRFFYTSMFGVSSDSETWGFEPNMQMALENRNENKLDHKIVWYGGIESHKKSSIDWFINSIYPAIKQKMPDVEFHLWGKGSEHIYNENLCVYGHGKYMGEGMPESNALYINPDIIGGGVKIKLMSLIENGIPFISSIFGYEGYSKEIIDDKYIVVKEESEWVESILRLLRE